MSITSVKPSLQSITFDSNLNTSVKSSFSPKPKPVVVSEEQLRTVLNASRASSDAGTITDASVNPEPPTTQASKPSLDDLRKILQAIYEGVKFADEVTGGPVKWQQAGEQWK